MIIYIKNKHSLKIDDFYLKCCIGKNGLTKNKKEGDKKTPIGRFSIENLYYRSDRIQKPLTNLRCIKIEKKMGWCDDAYSKNYNKEIVLNKKNKGEKLFRKDNAYDVLIVIEYNTNKTKPFKGSAIFIHLTKNYGPTKGCIALKKNDLLILLQIINKKSKIKIC